MIKPSRAVAISSVAIALIGLLAIVAILRFSSTFNPGEPGTAGAREPAAITASHQDDDAGEPAASAAKQHAVIAEAADGTRSIVVDGEVYPLRTYKPLASTPSRVLQGLGGRLAGVPAGSDIARYVPERYEAGVDESPGAVDRWSDPLEYASRGTSTNDPYADQWWTRKSGLDTVWADAGGSRKTVVAVIDTGFGLQHEEFKDRWALNGGEQGTSTLEAPSKLNCTDRQLPVDKSCNLIDDDYDGTVDNEAGQTKRENPSQLNCTDRQLPLNKSCNMIDDEGNGYVDDVKGWDFVNYDSSPQAGQTAPDGAGTAHGSQVTGVLAASGNNGKGIAGVDWSTRILPLQSINDEEYGNSLTVARAIRYAVDQNADVINLSLGTDQEDPYLRQVIRYALDNGVIVVAASGNDGCDCISYPARYPEVIAVGAESSAGGPTAFSSYGAELDVLAPGNNITTTTWRKDNPVSAYASGVAGTSFSAPYVSGLLARARAYQPDASWAEITGVLLANANHAGLTLGAPTSPTLGSGYARADTFIGRLKTLSTPQSRYYLGPLSAKHPLSTTRVHQCLDGDFPSAALYEMKLSSEVRYTVNKLEKERAAESGWGVKHLWYACVGLKGDKPTHVRDINLHSEIRNGMPNKFSSIEATPRGMSLYVDPALAQAGRPSQIANQPTATWLIGGSGDIRAAADTLVGAATAQGTLATLVAYNIPARDCGGYSTGGTSDGESYKTWIRQLAAGIGRRQAIVILEPDALAQLDCLSAADQAARYATLSDAVSVLATQTKAFVYIDAGHSAWINTATMAERLKKANVAQARGFSLNISNFQTSASNILFGDQLAAITGKKYVIDTSRNGRGANGEWCNPRGRALGKRPSTNTTGSLDAYLWIKIPGESDGICNGGPPAGTWWEEYAQELILNAGY